MKNQETQVVIYFDDPRGQLLQVSYGEFRSYWRRLGWKLENKAPELPGMPVQRREFGAQANLI